MTHYHHQEHLDTYAAVAGNCPANLLMAGLSAVSLGKKKRAFTDGFVRQMSGLLSERAAAGERRQPDEASDWSRRSMLTPFTETLLLGK